MNVSSRTIILREFCFRWVTAFAAASIVAIAVTMVLLSEQVSGANEAATRRIQRDIGLNIVILPPQTELDAWWIDRMPRGSMPEEWIDRLEDQDVANRLVPMLVSRVRIGASECLLTGIAEERFKRGKSMKPVFGRTIEDGSIMLGATVASAADAREGEPLEIRGRSLVVSRILEPTGSEEDVRGWVSLRDAQAILELPGRLNEIRALECHCSEDVEDPLEVIRAQLEPIVPGARVVRMNALADARRSQRMMAERIVSGSLVPVLVLCGVIVGMLSLVNVRERRREMGVLIALGRRRSSVAVIVMGRTFLIGLARGAGGLLITSLAGVAITEGIVGAPPPAIMTWEVMIATLLFPPVFCMLASFYPAIIAAMVDPARLMRMP